MSDLSVQPVYLSARAAIVAPERAIPVTLYATQKWLPRLGPERWCLVLLLRSLCVDSERRGDGTKRVACSWRKLAEMLDVHEETVASWLKHQPIPDDKPWRSIVSVDERAQTLALFIPRLRYAYETSNGKTRRTGFLLEILMEDPVAPEDEARLQQQIELMQMQQGELGLKGYHFEEPISRDEADLRSISAGLARPPIEDSIYVNQSNPDLRQEAKSDQVDLHNQEVNRHNPDLPPPVKQYNLELSSYVNPNNQALPPDESEDSGKNVNELDLLIYQLKQNNLKKKVRREAFEPIIHLTELLLNDNHSRGMLFKVLNALYPQRLDLYVAAVRVALAAAEEDPQVNKGAVFVRSLREFADVAGVSLGLRGQAPPFTDAEDGAGHRSAPTEAAPAPFAAPPVAEAIWAETQLVLRRQMTQATYNAIIQGTVLLGRDQADHIIGVRTEMAKEWLENRLYDIVQRALSGVIGEPVGIKFRLHSEPDVGG